MIRLEEAATLPAAAVGGKAGTLARAMREGLPVPPGAVIAPDEAVDARAVVAAVGPGPYAVRSSAPDEDAADRSWAGQLASIVPVDAADLAAAVAEVRASAGTERARAYGGDGRAIPVLVQRVVDADAAGIAFSLDPSDGDERYCVVEAVPGLATALADGESTPARWRVDVETGLAVEAAGRGPLPGDALAGVVELTRRAAEWLGRPCDVEWAWDRERVWLLQARPVTAAGWSPAPGQWTAANVSETMPGVVTPHTSSIVLEDELPATIDRSLRDLGLVRDGERVAEGGRFYGHAYWRVDRIKERLLLVPGFVERAFDETVGIAPSYQGDGRRSRVTPRTLRRALRVGLALLRKYRADGPAAKRYEAALERRERAWLATPWDELSDDELAERVAAARAEHRRANHHALTVTFLAEQAQDVARELVRAVGGRLDPPVNDRLVLTGLGALATARPTAALEEAARRHAGSRDAILEARAVADLPSAAARDLESIVERYGWMASADDELALPRWDEDPAQPLALFQAAVRAAALGSADGLRELDDRRRREERRLLAASTAWRPVLRLALSVARRYQGIREDLRVSVARANRILRRAVLAQGRRWSAGGVLAEPGDAFWLTADECDRLPVGGIDPARARELVASRRRHARRFREWTPPPVLGATAASAAPCADGAGRAQLVGVACSSGMARGQVAVLRRIEDVASVEPGSVLVVKNGTPGWTPAFVVAGALVTEEGGLLSHSAVIARERGLPAVINVPRATETLRDGEPVEVDGGRGLVTLLGEAGA